MFSKMTIDSLIDDTKGLYKMPKTTNEALSIIECILLKEINWKTF